MTNKLKFATRAIHAGQKPCPATGAIMTPIYASSTFVQSSPGEHLGYEYSRTQNPTREAYENCIASLEDGRYGFSFTSGMAAISAIIDLLPKDSHIIATNDLYGGTFRLFDKVRKITSGLSVTYLDEFSKESLANALKPNTKLIWAETPSNPMLKLVDIELVATFAKANKIMSVIDNTFATPFIQKPLNYGIDVVVHSATKYLNGHSDVINGVVIIGDNSDLNEQLSFVQNSVGGGAQAFDCFLVLRSLKTLTVRMRQHLENATELANWLDSHPKINQVIYPGLESHPDYQLAKKQMSGFGAMISIELNANLEQTLEFLQRTKLFSLAESLGGVESLIEHPAIMTHASIPLETRAELGIKDNLVRLSVGIEDIADLKQDLSQALEVMR
jgi:cystathionine beta-lyase/cystathionine gamma-synthase